MCELCQTMDLTYPYVYARIQLKGGSDLCVPLHVLKIKIVILEEI